MILVFAKSAGVPESMASRVDLLDMEEIIRLCACCAGRGQARRTTNNRRRKGGRADDRGKGGLKKEKDPIPC